MNQKGIASIAIILIIVGVLIIAGGIWYWQNQKEKPAACAQDAQLCPDGSYVSRTGSDCEFAACPELNDETADWQTYRNEKYGFEFKYPNYWTFRESLTFDSNSNYKLSVRYISKEQNSAPAPTYCTANQGDPRCQTVKIYDNYSANIDWQWGGDNFTYIDIYSPDGGRVEIYVTDFIATDKAIVLQILSTFKFTK